MPCSSERKERTGTMFFYFVLYAFLTPHKIIEIKSGPSPIEMAHLKMDLFSSHTRKTCRYLSEQETKMIKTLYDDIKQPKNQCVLRLFDFRGRKKKIVQARYDDTFSLYNFRKADAAKKKIQVNTITYVKSKIGKSNLNR